MKRPAQKWFVLGTTSLGAFIGAFMFTSVNVALPSLVRSLETEFNVVQWVVLAFLLATGTLLPIVGRLADMLGKKKLYLLGFGIFTVGTLLCALAPNVYYLIGFRAVQGMGSAFLTALGLAIVTDVFPAEERGRAIGISGALLSTGIVIGPTIGGLLIDAFSWRWIFYLAVPLGLLGATFAQRYIAEYEPQGSQRFDVPGAALLFLSLLTLMLGLTVGQDRGFTDPIILSLYGACAVFTIVFLWLELRVDDPVLDLRLFKSSQLSIGLATGFITFVAISGTIFLMPFYLSDVLGYSPRNVGLLMSVIPIFLVITAPIAGSFADKHGERPVTVVGLLFLTLGYFTISTISTETTALGYILRFLPVGLGMGIFQTPNNSAIMGAVSSKRSGVAGGLLALTRTVGQSTGIAVLGTLWAARVLARGGVSETTSASGEVQVGALHDMFLLIQVMIIGSLALALWDMYARRHETKAKAAPAD